MNSTTIECLLPDMSGPEPRAVAEYTVDVQFNEKEVLGANPMHQLHVYADPIFKDSQVFTDKTRIILIEVRNETIGPSVYATFPCYYYILLFEKFVLKENRKGT